MADNKKNEFTFISEKVKKKPFYKSRWFLKGCQGVVLSICFGGVTGLTFAVATPWAERQFGEPNQVERFVFVETESETNDESELLPAEESETETELETEPETTEPQTIIEKKELEITDYKQLYAKMATVADEAAKSIVTVTGETSSLDWLDDVIANRIQTAGLVIEIGGHDVFILTENQTIEYAERIVVTFRDDTTAEAVVQKRDPVSGLAVVKVSLEDLSEPTKLSMKKPELSGTAIIRQGEPVIALGSPINNSNAVAFGMVTSVVDRATVDDEYRVMTTDIIGSSQGSGILINLDGRIVGIIAQQFAGDNNQITLTALTFSKIKGLIEALVNNDDWTYMGITGKEITEVLTEEVGIPRGIYVNDTATDSPAMRYGIQGGDVLVSINEVEIHSMQEYVEELQKHSPEEVVKIGLKRSTLDGYADMTVDVTLGRN